MELVDSLACILLNTVAYVDYYPHFPFISNC